MDERTCAPFASAFRALLLERGVSLRTVAAMTALVDGRGLRHSYLGYLRRGERAPTVENMVLLARVFELPDDYFREVREHDVAVLALRLAREHGADAVRAKLDELG